MSQLPSFKSAAAEGPESGMRQRTLRAGVWMGLLLGMRQPSLLLRSLILARILAPREFGLMAIVLSVNGLTQAIGAFGLNGALVQRKEVTDRELDTTWTFALARGLVVTVVIVAAAPLVAGFFDAPEVANLVRVAALAPFFKGAENVAVVKLDRDLDYGKRFVLEMSGTAVQIIVSIGLALWLRDVWALVLGLVAGAFVSSLLSYLIIDYRPRLRFSGEDFRSLAGFSGWVSLSAYLRSLSGSVDFIIIGRLTDVATLGLYQMAWRFSNVVNSAFNNLAIPRISFSNYARIQDDPVRMRRGYRLTVEFVLSLALPMVTVLAMLSVEIVAVVLGPTWADSAGPMSALAVTAGLRAVRAQANSVLLGVGDARLAFFMNLGTTVLMIGGLFYATPRWGVTGAAWAVAVAVGLLIPVGFLGVRRHIGASTKDLVEPLVLPVGLSVLVGALAFGVRPWAATGALGLMVAGAIIGLVYLAGLVLAWRTMGRGPLAVLQGRASGNQSRS